MAIELTERAAQEVRRIFQDEGLGEDVYLRLAVKGGGCSGFNYVLDVAKKMDEGDELFETNGVKVICDQKSYLYVNGTTVDFKDKLMERGFVFNNPIASGTCGCGSSFRA